MSVGENIKLLRNKYGLSQKQIGIIAGVSDKAISTWENGKKEPRMGAIQKIADHFGVKKSDLIEDEGLIALLDDGGRQSEIGEAPLSAQEKMIIKAYRMASAKERAIVEMELQEYLDALKRGYEESKNVG